MLLVLEQVDYVVVGQRVLMLVLVLVLGLVPVRLAGGGVPRLASYIWRVHMQTLFLYESLNTHPMRMSRSLSKSASASACRSCVSWCFISTLPGSINAMPRLTKGFFSSI